MDQHARAVNSQSKRCRDTFHDAGTVVTACLDHSWLVSSSASSPQLPSSSLLPLAMDREMERNPLTLLVHACLEVAVQQRDGQSRPTLAHEQDVLPKEQQRVS